MIEHSLWIVSDHASLHPNREPVTRQGRLIVFGFDHQDRRAYWDEPRIPRGFGAIEHQSDAKVVDAGQLDDSHVSGLQKPRQRSGWQRGRRRWRACHA